MLLPLPAWAAGPFDGTWKMQLDKTQVQNKPMEQTVQTDRVSIDGNKLKIVSVDAQQNRMTFTMERVAK